MIQEAAEQAVHASSPSAGAAVADDATADGTAMPPPNALQQQWAPEPEEEDEEDEEENVGQWSPVPLDAQHIGNQDVVHEDDDQRLIDLLRKQVSLVIYAPINFSLYKYKCIYHEIHYSTYYKTSCGCWIACCAM